MKFQVWTTLLLSAAVCAVSARELDFGAESGRRYAGGYGQGVTLNVIPGGMSADFTDQSKNQWCRKGFGVKLVPAVQWKQFEAVRLELENAKEFSAVGIMIIDTEGNLFSAKAKKSADSMTFSRSEIQFRYNEKGKKGKPQQEYPLTSLLIYGETPKANTGKNYRLQLKKVEFAAPAGQTVNWQDPDWSSLRNPSLAELKWEQTSAPGDGGTSWYLRIHPSDDKILVQSCDMGGNYMTWNGSKSYSSINDADWTFPRIAYISAADFCTSAPETGYIGTEGNGLFKTTDKGKSWQKIDTSALEMKFKWAFPRIPVSALTVNPQNPQEVWAGIGYPRRNEYRGGYRRRLPQGLIHSTDGGKTWNHIADAFPQDEMALAILYFKNHPNLLIVGTDGGVYRSDDAGKTFRSIRDGLPQPSGFGGFDGITDPKTGLPVIAAALESEYDIRDGKAVCTGGVWRYDWTAGKWHDLSGNLRFPIELIDSLPDQKKGFAASPYGVAAYKYLWREFLKRPEAKQLYDTVLFKPQGNAGKFFTLWNNARKDRFVTQAANKFREQKLTTYLPDFHTVKIDPRDPGTIYASIFQAQLPYGLWKTSNGGKHWVQVCRGARGWQDPVWKDYVPQDGILMNMSQSWTRRQPMNYGTENVRMGFWDIRKFDLSKSNPDVLYLHSHRITYRSDDAGKTWRDASNHMLDEKHARFSGRGNSNICVFGLQFHPLDPDKVLFYMADSGVKVSSDGGKSLFALEETMFGSNQWVEGAAFDPADPRKFYVLFNCRDWLLGGLRGYYFLKTSDFGKTFEGVSNPENGTLKLPPRLNLPEHLGNLRIDPASPADQRRMLASNARLNRQKLLDRYASLPKNQSPAGVVESTDGGKTWHASNQGLGELKEVVDLYSPDNMKTVYAAVAAHRKLDGKGGLYRSTDGGKTWAPVPSPCDSVTQVIAVKGTLYIAGGRLPTPQDSGNHGGVWKSTDDGKTWIKLFGAPLVNNLTVNPRNPDYLYCTVEDGTHGAIIPAVGIYRSADGGKTWNRINRGLAFPWGFMQFVWHPTRNELWLSTYGSGCYKLIDNIQ